MITRKWTGLRLGTLVAALLAGAGAPHALAQASNRSAPNAGAAMPQRENMIKLSRTVTVEFTQQPLGEIMDFIANVSGGEIEVMWLDDRSPEGLERDTQITLRAQNVTALKLIERVLQKVPGGLEQNTWQFAPSGELQVGPKARLNRFRRLEIYDIRDLLSTLPQFPDAPSIDLQQAISSAQGGGGGGGGQGPFQDSDQDNQRTREEIEQERQDRADQIIDLITNLVEFEQWDRNGGDGGTIRFWQDSLLINAPDYMHRQLIGYRWWPAAATSVSMVNGRRYVTLDVDTGVSKVEGFTQFPTSAVVGGQIIRSGGGG